MILRLLLAVGVAEGAAGVGSAVENVSLEGLAVDGAAGGANPSGRRHGLPVLVGEGVEIVGLVLRGGLVVLALEDAFEVEAFEVREPRLPERCEQRLERALVQVNAAERSLVGARESAPAEPEPRQSGCVPRQEVHEVPLLA